MIVGEAGSVKAMHDILASWAEMDRSKNEADWEAYLNSEFHTTFWPDQPFLLFFHVKKSPFWTKIWNTTYFGEN